MTDSISRFVSRLGARGTTADTYSRILRQYQEFCGVRPMSDPDAAADFLSRAGCARTRNLYLVVINLWRASCKLRRLDLRAARPPKKQFNTTRIQESFDALLPRCRVERDRALLALLRYGGLRISEAINLRVGDVTFPQGQLQISITVSKTTPRDPLVWRATKFLRDYLDRSPAGSDRWLFPSRARGHIQRRGVEAWLARESVAVGYRITPHDLRRLCATEMAEKFGVRVLCDYFGWSSAATAEIYIDRARGSSTSAILGELGIGNKSDLFTTSACWRCGTKNAPNAVHCCTCGELLDRDSVPMREHIDGLDAKGLEALLVEILKKRGILPP